MIYIVKNNSTDRRKVEEVISFVQDSGGIAYAFEKMKAYQQEAMDILSGFAANDARRALEELVGYVIDRKY